jgi:trk system potassium uptake protein TrkA
MAQFLVVGLGSFGMGVATFLQELGHGVAAVDLDGDRVERAATHLRHVLEGDGTDPDLLERLGAREVDAAVVSTGGDVTSSVLTVLALRGLGVGEIHGKVISDLHARILEKVGVSGTIFPERESARFFARRVCRRNLLRYTELQEGLGVQEMHLPTAWVGRSLRQLELPKKHRIMVLGVRDEGAETLETIPDPNRPLEPSQTLVVAGDDRALERVARLP